MLKKPKELSLLITTLFMGFLDRAVYFFENAVYEVLRGIAIALTVVLVLAGLLYFQTPKLSSHLYYLLSSNLYKTSQPSRQNNNNVLGAQTVKEHPVVIKDIPVPKITAKSALVIDMDTGRTLFDLNSDAKYAPASTTKLVTALVSLNLYTLDQDLSVPEFCTTLDSQRVGLLAGKHYSVKDLLYSLLIESAGDSACVLATSKMAYGDFVQLMNDTAAEMDMANTHFSNPVGLDGINGDQISTAEDLYKLTNAALKSDLIREIVKTREYRFKYTDKPSVFGPLAAPDKNKASEIPEDPEIYIFNTNKLLWDIPQTIGVKTGTTAEAGEVLIYEYKDDLRTLLIIVMGSTDRFEDTKALLGWVTAKYSWE